MSGAKRSAATAPALLAAALAVGVPRAGTGQDLEAYLSAGVSHARPPADVEADPATYGQLGARLLAGPFFGSLDGGLAIDAGSADWLGAVLGGTLGAAHDGPLRLTLTGLVAGFTLGAPTRYDAVTGRLVPEAQLRLGRLTGTVRGYAGLGRSVVADPSTVPTNSVSSDLWMYGGALELRGPLGPAQAAAGLEAYGSATGAYFAAYTGAAGTLSQAVWTALVKVWDTPDDKELELQLSLRLPLARRLALDMVVGHSGPDPLLASPAGMSGSVTASWRAVAPRESQPLYTLSGGPEPVVRFRLERGGAEAVSVIGDFSAWSPIAMRREGRAWLAEVSIEPGVYHFGFLVDGEWYLPEDAPGQVSDEFGRANATLVVPRR